MFRIALFVIGLAQAASGQQFTDISLSCIPPTGDTPFDSRGQCANRFLYVEWRTRPYARLNDALMSDIASRLNAGEHDRLRVLFPDFDFLAPYIWEPEIQIPHKDRSAFCQIGENIPLISLQGQGYFDNEAERQLVEQSGTRAWDDVNRIGGHFAFVNRPTKVYRCYTTSWQLGWLATIDFYPTSARYENTLEWGLIAQFAYGFE